MKHEMKQSGRRTQIYAIVPVKASSTAKSRLARALSSGNRRTLALTMLSDVLEALHKTRGLQRIVVVTRDIDAARLAARKRALVISEGRAHGLNSAIRTGLLFAEREGADQALIIPADIPLSKSSDFQAILKMGHEGDIIIVPSHDLRGTNGLLLHPPRVMPVSYGIDSFRRHCRLAQERNLTIRVLKLKSIGLDADTPLDLIAIRSAFGNTLSQRFLRVLN